MAYNIPIMSGLKIPNEEELVNLTPEQKAAINKLYLLHSKHVEVDCIKPKKDENGNVILDENNQPEVEKEYTDLGTILGQLSKTVGTVHWNSNGLNEAAPIDRMYPDLEIDYDSIEINYDDISARIQTAINGMDIEGQVATQVNNQIQTSIDAAQISNRIDAISTTLSAMENNVDSVSATVESVSSTIASVSSTVASVSSNMVLITDEIDSVSASIVTLADDIETTSSIVETIRSDLLNLNTTIDSITATLLELADSTTAINNEIQSTSDAVDLLQKKIDNLYNYNYLDNSNFENPINQRKHLMTNETQYQSGSKSIYTIDRWFLSTSSILSIKTDTIEISGTLTQTVQRPSEDISVWTVLATKIENNQEVVKQLNIDLSNNDTSFSNSGINVLFGNDLIFVSLTNGEWKNIGLYKGNQARETWTYVAKSFNEELFNCMKYFYHYEGRSQIIIEGYTILNVYGFIPVQMRVIPTITGINTLKNIKFRASQIGVLAPVAANGYLDNSDAGLERFDYKVNLVDYLHLSYNSLILEDTETSTSLGQFVIPLSYNAINYPAGEDRKLWYNGSGFQWNDTSKVSTGFNQLSVIQESVVENGNATIINIGQWYEVPSIKQDFGGSCFISIDFSADFGTNIE